MKPVIAKIKEELQELEDEIESGKSEAIDEEFGDFLFVVANLARHLKLDPEDRIRAANRKFEKCFSRMEDILKATGQHLPAGDLATMAAAWDRAQAEEKATSA